MRTLVLILSLLLATSCEAKSSPAEVYWNNVLPKTTMPSAIKDLLMQLDISDDQRAATSSQWKWNAASMVIVLPMGGATSQWSSASTVKVLPSGDATSQWQAGDSKMSYDQNITVHFFKKEDLHPGNKMTLSFPDPSIYSTRFITKKAAKSIPFTTSKLADVLNHFSIEPKSAEAEAMKETLTNCEARAMDGEIKFCATSLQSMVEFATSAVGTRNAVAISTTADRKNPPKQQYEIRDGGYEKASDGSAVVCHAQTYAYAMHYCHKLKGVEVYRVWLVGRDGTKVDTVATCHTDTSQWNPEHVALRMLKVKPGTVPVCHFLPQYDVVWLPNK